MTSVCLVCGQYLLEVCILRLSTRFERNFLLSSKLKKKIRDNARSISPTVFHNLTLLYNAVRVKHLSQQSMCTLLMWVYCQRKVSRFDQLLLLWYTNLAAMPLSSESQNISFIHSIEGFQARQLRVTFFGIEIENEPNMLQFGTETSCVRNLVVYLNLGQDAK